MNILSSVIKCLFGLVVVFLGTCNAIKCHQCYRLGLHGIVIENDRKECQDPFTGDGVHTIECDTGCIKDETIFANETSIVNRRGCKDIATKCECEEKDNGEDRSCCLLCDDRDLCNTSSFLQSNMMAILWSLPLIRLVLNW
ncbi:uncharacterized protein [Antedon mediterranea]|uniref:uncharacterized protein n=1 Tax=Antedon mediterranea TaxID=105859 RepID=UPI003AF53B9C